MRGELEEHDHLYQRDEVLATVVPAALVTYRQVVTQYGTTPATESALWKLGHLYADTKRYQLAADAFRNLAERYPETRFDAWFAAAEVYDKQLHDKASARTAYANVPPASPNFERRKDACVSRIGSIALESVHVPASLFHTHRTLLVCLGRAGCRADAGDGGRPSTAAGKRHRDLRQHLCGQESRRTARQLASKTARRSER
jgi:tetratricopeptide (TPR) repeat protein